MKGKDGYIIYSSVDGMKIARETIKNSYSQLLMTSIICICFFGINMFLNFATDTYATLHDVKYTSNLMLHHNGRLFTGLLYKIWYTLNLTMEDFYTLSYALALVFLIFSVFLLQDVLKVAIKKDSYRICISFISVANIYIIEYFTFIEKSMFMFAIFFNVLGFCFMMKYYQKRNVMSCVIVVLCILIAAFTYQGTVGLFVVLCLPFILKYSNTYKEYFINGFVTMFCYGIACLTNYLYLKVFLNSGKVKESSGLINNLLKTIKGIKSSTISTFSILPDYVFYVLLLVVIFISLFLILRNFKGIDLWIQILNLFIIFIGTSVISCITIIMGSGWFCPRVVYPYASIIGIYIINIYVNILAEKRQEKGIYDAVIFVTVVVLLAVQYICFSRIFIDKYLNDYVDKYRATIIKANIEEYEATTGNEVTHISFYRDGNSDMQYDNLFAEGDLVVSSFVTDWSDLESINYYSKSQYLRGEVDDSYQMYFDEKDWKTFSEEQLIFDGNVLHLCVY